MEAPVRTLEEAELRTSLADRREPARGPLSDPFAEATEAEGRTPLRPPVVLGFGLVALRASDAGCCVADLGETGEICVGPALTLEIGGMGVLPHRPRWLEFTRELAGGGAPRLLREATLLVLVMRDLATLAPPSSSSPSSSSSSSSDPVTESPAWRAELTVDGVSARSNFD